MASLRSKRLGAIFALRTFMILTKEKEIRYQIDFLVNLYTSVIEMMIRRMKFADHYFNYFIFNYYLFTKILTLN